MSSTIRHTLRPFTAPFLRSPARLHLRPTIAASAPRAFHARATPLLARKETMDKDSLAPRSTEYSVSGTDDAAAESEAAAFDPQKTSPEEEQRTAEREMGGGQSTHGGGSPLEVSPGNQESSKTRDPQEGGAEDAPDRGPSGGGSPTKHGGGKSG